ncbi:hypothetical protein PWO95_04675 [Weissella paramesenteroides]|uniref:hypothetical protein n=1 Tax=Weissella paramesenteroides TaxID=1249 RepID=UPI0023A9BA64|nr:hypothetical protein [Weissella paramesenteroides]WEA53853.1 hypothetical protein PWO95_04675 [Weissella paramesenteroides]
MIDKNMNIDPHEFALALISNSKKEDGVDNQRFIKNQLTLYLEAYFIIEDFNQLEIKQLNNMKQQQISDLFDKMLSGRFTP